MNYGHALEFGTFITPKSDDPSRTVSLARRSEELGYDLVTFQDHPYLPHFLDTWTLMSWAAGQTSRIRIAANVLNLPLRQPAVLGRSAASLDILSGGRFELGLGAGAFWDGIGAMGESVLKPGEAVEATDEAIDIIRGIWDAGNRRPLRFQGERYTIPNAQRGPLPAHDIPVWLGAMKPRMLRLLGRKADGWMVSASYLKPGDLRRGNLVIDEAATAAGRDPREIRRMLNIGGAFTDTHDGFLTGPAEAWVGDLLPLVLEDGIGTFILTTDDEAMLERFAKDVIPALKAAAIRALPELEHAKPVRRADALAKRRDGIDYDGVPDSLASVAIEPGDIDFARVKDTYMRGGHPGIVFRVRDTQQVVDALAYARKHPDIELSVRSGGHGVSGRSTNNGGIVIDLGEMDSIEVLDIASRRVRLGPGARWMEVAAALQPYGWAITSGDYGGVGVGGLSTAGGIGFMTREHGLTIDHVRAVEMVLADGSVVRASEDENADLFWAVRGAGANFGIVTSFEMEADEVGNIGWAQLVFDASDTSRFLQGWGAAIEASPRDTTGELIMGQPRAGQPYVAQALILVNSDAPETIISRLQPIAQIAPLYQQNIVITTYENIISNAQDTGYHTGMGEPLAHNGNVAHITPSLADATARLLQGGATFFFQIRSLGGAVSDVAPDATAFADREANFNISAMGQSRRRLDPMWEELRDHFTGMYLSFETDRSIERLHDAFPPETLRRLREIKATYDPDNVFRDNFNIAPLAVVR